ncbi:MAG: hypothetical protein DUD39_10880 [Coriobacteriaceae bacterium]|nr:MAG: hypothetical protein DUD39_10880 [Coriobacteriaceae bacterium]
MKVGWQKIGDIRYYFYGSGAMATGWGYINGAWYWFTPSGRMAPAG